MLNIHALLMPSSQGTKFGETSLREELLACGEERGTAGGRAHYHNAHHQRNTTGFLLSLQDPVLQGDAPLGILNLGTHLSLRYNSGVLINTKYIYLIETQSS